MLVNASRALKTSVLAVMESTTAEPKCIEQVRQSTATLTVPWESLLRSLRMAVRECVYERYLKWYTSSGKRKYSPQPSESVSSKRAKKTE